MAEPARALSAERHAQDRQDQVDPLPLRRSPGLLRPDAPVEVTALAWVRTDRLLLRPLQPTDRDEFLRVLAISRDHVAPWLPLNEADETDADYFQRQLALTEIGERDNNAWRRVAVLPGGRIVGCFNLHSISRGLEWEADAAWWVAADALRQGFATEGVNAMVEHALSPLPRGLGLGSVHCGVDPANEPSRRVALACGFEIRQKRSSFLKIAGRWVKHDFYLRAAKLND